MRLNTKYNTLLIPFSLFVGFVFCALDISAQTYGLKFQGHDVTLDKRTELDLFPGEFIKFNDEFEISFEYKITRIEQNSNVGFFGYIFRIINSEDKNIDLLSTPTPAVGLNLVIGESNTIIPIEFPLDWINNWVRFRIKFILSEDRLIFYTPDTFYVHEHVGLRKTEQVKIIYGANDYKQFRNSDVPSMIINDIKILEKGKLKYNWLLNEKEGNLAIDKIYGKKAKIKNPSWYALNHESWQKIFEQEFNGIISVTANNVNGDIYIIGEKELTLYSTQKNNVKNIKYSNESSFLTNQYRSIFNNLDNKPYCYLADNGPCYCLDTETGEWAEIITSGDVNPFFRHHNSNFHEHGNDIYIFGGYGLHKYSNQIIRIDLESKKWVDITTNDSVFYPRYLAGMGSLNDTLYILGGYGSKSGNQLINPQSYFDLIGYSINDSSLFYKFEIPHLIDDMIVGNSMWIDGRTRNYYALVYSKITFDGSLQLIKGKLDFPDATFVGSKIPFKFLDVRSFVDLYYMPDDNKLYAYTSYYNDSITQLAIYSIDSPPNNSQEELFFTKGYNIVKYIAASLLLIIILLIILRLMRGRNPFKKASDSTEINNEDLLPGTSEMKTEEINYQIIFFGGFQIFDKNFQDITSKFSPVLKELFLLILLYSFKNDKGISSEKITEILWNDKSEKSARNNRSVNIAKLRSILEEIGNCELSKKTGYWKINFTDTEIKSDYIDFINISKKSKLTKLMIIQLIEITYKGAFLSNLHYDWLDDFKASVSDKIIDTLLKFSQTIDVKEEGEFLIHLADSVFNFDLVNEDAMILKCKAQYCMGKHSHAKATYERFYKEYAVMYGQEYDKAFLDIIHIKE